MGTPNLISFHRKLLNDFGRMNAYREAIQSTVRPGDIVLDAGSGSGILAMFACQAGAKRVYAVEREDIIFAARQLAKENGFEDRIVFLRQQIKDVDIPEPVDVIISELISKSVLGQKMSETIGWCRDSFLKPGGRILPEKVTLWIAPVENEKFSRHLEFPETESFGINFDSFRQRSLNYPHSTSGRSMPLLAPGQPAYLYHAFTSPLSDKLASTLVFEPSREAVVHGFVTWFTALLSPTTTLSTFPPGTPSWDNHFFPLINPLNVSPGMKIELFLRGCDDSQSSFLWQWITTLKDQDRVVASCHQSSLAGQILSPDLIKNNASTRIASLNAHGRIAHHVLSLLGDNKLSMDEIASRILEKFSDRFSSIQEALIEVRKIAAKFTEQG